MNHHYRTATIDDVAYGLRQITLIAVPYDVETLVNDGRGTIREKFTRTAFTGIESRASRITVNRDHSRERAIGVVKTFNTTDRRGLIATVKISSTALGDESLQLAADGVLRASVAFSTKPKDAPVVNGLRTVNRAELHHIALTPEPAYEGAEVLDVRTGNPIRHTPNLDQARQMLARSITHRW